jgi:membrane protease YdiL (CAAX protease family)
MWSGIARLAQNDATQQFELELAFPNRRSLRWGQSVAFHFRSANSVRTLDYLYLALIAIALLIDHFVIWSGFVRRSEADAARPRLWLWRSWMILLWTLVATGVVLWVYTGRNWDALKFVWPQGWRLWIAIGLVLALAITQSRTAIRIARSNRSKRIKIAFPAAEKLSPRTGSEMGWFVALSLTAGFCEEFIFRGYLIWAFQPLFGLWGAAAFSVVVFAFAHAYQGPKGILSTGFVGLLFTLVVLITGSLWPAIALHALVDIGQGLIAWLVMRRMDDHGGMIEA